jgi:cyclase
VLKVRVIPTLLWRNFGLVKGIGFDSGRRIGTLMPAIKVYNTRDVDELILLDICATLEDRDLDYDSIEEVAAECFVPLTVGGGIRSVEQIRRLLRVGADKICINSAAYERPELIREAAAQFGSQCIVASIDVRRSPDGQSECVSRSGTRPQGKPARSWAVELEGLGAGERLVTSIERDGTMQGYDLDLVREIAEAVTIPVIASGGAGSYEQMASAVETGKASAVAAASIFHFTEQTPIEAKRHMASRGIPVRGVNASVIAA